MVIAYDGSDYAGWQIQLREKTVQGEIEKALAVLLRQKISIVGAGRTDGGVHAEGQTAHFYADGVWEPKKILASLNGILPFTVRIRSLGIVPESFHARFSVTSKIYVYHLWSEVIMNPLYRHYRWHVGPLPYPEALEEGARLFVGEKDFSSFSNDRFSGACLKNPVREILRLDVIRQEGGLRLEFEGKSFLYKMVRNITGTLLAVARGKISPETIRSLLEGRDRTKAPAPAPAKGLCLKEIKYDD